MKTKLSLIIAIVIVVALIILAAILVGKKEEGPPAGPSGEETTIPAEIYGFTGIIKEIKDKTLSVEASIPLADTTKPPLKQTIKVAVTDATKIAKLKFPKSSEIPAGSEIPTQPTETKMNFSDLKIEDKINVGTVGNISENIKNKTEVTAKNIFIIEK